MRSRPLVIICAAAAVLFAGCRRERVAPAGNRAATSTQLQDLRNADVKLPVELADVEKATKSHLGSKTAKDGTVTEEKKTFKSGEPVFLTMWIQESPGGLQMSARWFGPDGKQFSEDRKTMHGEKVATFGVVGEKLKPGAYRVIGYWGGNVAAEHEFTVTK